MRALTGSEALVADKLFARLVARSPTYISQAKAWFISIENQVIAW